MTSSVSDQFDPTFVEQLVQREGAEPHKLITLLQQIQAHYHYLPPQALEHIARITQITPADIAGVSSFFSQFRHQPAGKHIIHVCHGTACHVKGSELLHDAIRRELHLPNGQDTDADMQFTVERVGCLGCCTLAPVLQIDSLTVGHAQPENIGQLLHEAVFTLEHSHAHPAAAAATASADATPAEIRIGVGSCCVAGGSQEVRQALEFAVRRSHAAAVVKPVGCVGMCHQTPLVEIVKKDGPSILYTRVTADSAAEIVRRHFPRRGFFARMRGRVDNTLNRLLTDELDHRLDSARTTYREQPICNFLDGQVRLATEYCGHLDPLDLDEYLSHHGLEAIKKVLLSPVPPADVVAMIESSGLRGRGGAGFPTGRKWRLVAAATDPRKFLICNGDEGDPGAFMDRMILESYPYRVIEGMMIAAWAVGAKEGRFYIRHEYPLAVERIRKALVIMRQRGLLGENILGSGFSFELEVVEGAGAFVCGEETALIASVEGHRGMPHLRPPYPAEAGLWNHPTLINNVETLALVPWILRQGAEAFGRFGTSASRGTKVFALTGKIRRGGLIEVPMGITIRQIVQQIGGGVEEGRQFKAVQIGGPSGGCIPASLADTPVDYESLGQIGAIMGSGGLVVLDDSDCMVDIARYFLQFTQAESCGKCTFCRVGTRRMLEILERFCQGQAQKHDLEKLELLAQQVKASSLCGLGQTAPTPVLPTLQYFRDEYEAHLKGYCPAGKCRSLVRYQVTSQCIGCTLCAQHCPVQAIPFAPYETHNIDQSLCTKCDVCRKICPENAINIVPTKS